MAKIRIGIIGLGNCASSLIQGLSYYKNKPHEEAIGLMHWNLGGYKPSDIEVALAFDIDKRKVGKDISTAIFEEPNCTKTFAEVPYMGIKVLSGAIMDGVSSHLENYDEKYRILPITEEEEPDKEEIIEEIKNAEIDMLINYIPVGSEGQQNFTLHVL